ncbi:DUF1707 SHOCT-like domain-containing protein [Geodermatophilus sp. URMC 64]
MPEPRMRAGDADRQQVVEKLGRHLGEGRLTMDEFDERVVRAHAAVYLDELPALTADLPEPPAPVPVRPVRRPGPPPAVAAVLLVLAAAWTVSLVAYGVAPILPLILAFLFLRHQRWSRRW